MIIVLPLLRNAQAKEQDAGGQEQVTGKAILFSVTPTVMIACGFNRFKAIL